MYDVYLVVPIICNWRLCSCFSDDRFQPNTAIFKSDGSDVYAYILCTWWSGVVTFMRTYYARGGQVL